MAALHPHPLILASGSPRRRDLLERAGIPFEIQAADIPEVRAPDEAPVEFASRLARGKARAVAERVGGPPSRWVLGADTIVVIDSDVLGKPVDPNDAVRLLSRLVGRTHTVVTAVALRRSTDDECRELAVESRVHMAPAERSEIVRYVETGEPLDKAGAYAVQGRGRRFVTSIDGSETNVIGLPVDETLALLRGVGIDIAQARR